MTSKKAQMDASAVIAAMAMQLCGTNFRLHGRSADHGLDCVGLAAQCLDAADMSCDVPTGYSIRGGSVEQIEELMERAGFVSLESGILLLEGDIMLVRPGPGQWHFMVKTTGGFVHAHAGIGRVVFAPGEAQWPIEKVFRIAED